MQCGGRDAERLVEGIPLRRQLAYAGLLLALALCVAELAMRAVFWWKGDLPPTPDESLSYEWKWARHHLAAGSAEPLSQGFRFDPQLGWTLRESFRDGDHATNALGLRSLREVPAPRPARRRVALLGDSFTYGDHVATDETYAYFLEHEQLEGWDVLNLAVNGYGTDQALLRYELLAADLPADVVVMGFYVRDYERISLRFKVYAKPVFVLAGEGLRVVGQPVPPPEALYEEYASGRRRVGETASPYLALSLGKSLRRLRERWPRESHPEWQVLVRLMRRFRDNVHSQGAVPLWLVIPHRDVSERGRSRYAAIEELCEREARRLELPILRLDGPFREHAAREPQVALYRPRAAGGHFSVSGHRRVAELLARWLSDQGLARPR